MRIILASIFTLMLISHAGLAADDNLRAYYEYKIEVAGNISTSRTSSKVVFGTPVKHEFGKYQLSLLFEPTEEGAGEYMLEISLNLLPLSATQNIIGQSIVTSSFTGRVATQSDFSQSEFNIDEGGVSLSLVIRLSEID